jgi:putative peptidoglycan lipid II flippase
MSDTTHSIFQSAKRFFTGTILSRVSGLLRDVAMAFAFGTHDSVAAFLVAFRFSHLLRRLLGEGALQTAFVPQFEKLRKESMERACNFFRDLSFALTALLVLIVVASMLVLGGLLAFANLNQGNQEIVWLTLLMMPSLLFICLFGINASLLQCEKNYFTSSFAPVAFNIVWIVGVFCLWQQNPSFAMPWLGGFIILACFFQWIFTIPATLKILKKCGPQRLERPIQLFSPDVKTLFKPLMLGMIGVGAAQINNALDAVFARYADSEGPAFLWYAIRLQQLPLALFGIALSGALLPPLSRAIKQQDNANYSRFLEFAISRSMLLMLPITFAFLVMGDSCINLIYGRGDFNDQSIIGTTQCLWGYGVGLVPMTLVLILAPAFYAREDYRTPTQASVIAMLLNIFLSGLMVTVLGLGSASVAFATSLSAWVNVALLALALKKAMGTFASRSMRIDIGKLLLASLAASAAVLITDILFWGESLPFEILRSNAHFTHYFSEQFVRLMGQFLFFCTTFALFGWLLNASELLKFKLSPPPSQANF